MDTQKLKGKMAEKNVTQKELAHTLNVTENTFSSKLSGKRDFSLSEVRKISQRLSLTKDEIVTIFLC